MKEYPEANSDTEDRQNETGADYRKLFPEAYETDTKPENDRSPEANSAEGEMSPEAIKELGETIIQQAQGYTDLIEELGQALQRETDPDAIGELNQQIQEAKNELREEKEFLEELENNPEELHYGFKKQYDAIFEKKIRKELKRQFDNPDIIELADGKTLEIIDLDPWQDYFYNPCLENPRDDTPLLLMQGFGQDARQIEENAVLFALRGRRVFMVKGVYGTDIKNLDSKTAELFKDIPEIERRKVTTVCKMANHVREKTGKTRYDAVTHSEASIYTTEATDYIELRSLIMVEPAGMIENDTVTRLAWGSVKDTIVQEGRIKASEFKHERLAKIAEKLGLKPRISKFVEKNIGHNPKGFDNDQAKTNARISQENFMRSALTDTKEKLRNVKIIADYNIGDKLAQLKEKGTSIVIMQTAHDGFFDMDKVMANKALKNVDNIITFNGSHGQLTIQPEQYTDAADNILHSLANKHENDPLDGFL